MFKTPLLVDRRVYDKKGKWKSPNNDIEENVFYFIKENLTIANEYREGREEAVETMTITIFGGKPIAIKDKITLENGTTYEVVGITPIFAEHNILVKDLLKPRIESTELILE